MKSIIRPLLIGLGTLTSFTFLDAGKDLAGTLLHKSNSFSECSVPFNRTNNKETNVVIAQLPGGSSFLGIMKATLPGKRALVDIFALLKDTKFSQVPPVPYVFPLENVKAIEGNIMSHSFTLGEPVLLKSVYNNTSYSSLAWLEGKTENKYVLSSGNETFEVTDDTTLIKLNIPDFMSL